MLDREANDLNGIRMARLDVAMDETSDVLADQRFKCRNALYHMGFLTPSPPSSPSSPPLPSSPTFPSARQDPIGIDSLDGKGDRISPPHAFKPSIAPTDLPLPAKSPIISDSLTLAGEVSSAPAYITRTLSTHLHNLTNSVENALPSKCSSHFSPPLPLSVSSKDVPGVQRKISQQRDDSHGHDKTVKETEDWRCTGLFEKANSLLPPHPTTSIALPLRTSAPTPSDPSTLPMNTPATGRRVAFQTDAVKEASIDLETDPFVNISAQLPRKEGIVVDDGKQFSVIKGYPGDHISGIPKRPRNIGMHVSKERTWWRAPPGVIIFSIRARIFENK